MKQVRIVQDKSWEHLEHRINAELRKLEAYKVLDIKLGWNSEKPISMIIFETK